MDSVSVGKRSISTYAYEFGQKHPDIGHVARGVDLRAAAMGELGRLVGGACQGIAGKSQEGMATTSVERSLVSRSADMLARTLYFELSRDPCPSYRGEPGLQAAINRVIYSAFQIGEALQSPITVGLQDVQTEKSPYYKVCEAINYAAGVVQEVPLHETRQFQTHCNNLTEIVSGSFEALEVIAQERGCLTVSSYTEGNIQEMIALYEKVEASQSQ